MVVDTGLTPPPAPALFTDRYELTMIAAALADGILEALRDQGLTDPRLLDFLAGFRFSGDVDGYAEGDLYFPGSPVLTVRAPFAERVQLEPRGGTALRRPDHRYQCARLHAAARRRGVRLPRAGGGARHRDDAAR